MSLNFDTIRVTGPQPLTLKTWGASPDDSYILKSVTGLDTPDLDIFVEPRLDGGGTYQSRRSQTREIVLTVGLNPNHAIGETGASLRHLLYGLVQTSPFDGNDELQVQLLNGQTVLAYTNGYIRRIESNPFSSDLEIQITILCPDPYFVSDDEIVTTPSTGVFVLEVGGSAATGAFGSVTLTAAGTSFQFGVGGQDPLRINASLQAGDVINFSTESGSRDIEIVRGASTINAIRYLAQTSKWPQLFPGFNNVYVNAPTYTWTQFWYIPKYWGV